MDGVNSYEIRDNYITSDFGAISIDNGIHSNEVFDNRFTWEFHWFSTFRKQYGV